MGDELFSNILGEQDIESLFSDVEEEASGETEEKKDEGKENTPQESEREVTTEIAEPEDLFDEEDDSQSESVGSEKTEGKEEEDTAPDKDSGTSPTNLYSSIASALAVDGIFPNLDEETVNKVDSAESLSEVIEAEVAARLDEKQRRVSKALDNGVEPTDIRKYETVLDNLSKITDKNLLAENESGEQLRRDIIYQDFRNKGYSHDKAMKLTERSIDAGNDQEDAKEALQSNREFFQEKYNELLEDAQKQADADRKARQKEADSLKESILKDKQLFGDMEISSDLRKKAFENISRPVYKDPETGEYLTALQKYEMEHRSDFLKYVGLTYTLTNGFKDFDSFTKGKVKKEVKKGLRELEKTLNSSIVSNGDMRAVTRKDGDPESFFRGMRLDF